MSAPSFRIGGPNNSGGAGGFVKAEHEAHLVGFVEPVGEQTSTVHGESEAVRCSYAICFDCRTVSANVLVWGTALVPRLLGTDDEIVAGRLVKGDAKPGRSAPWLLEDPLESDLEVAGDFLAKNAARMPSGKVVVEQPHDDEQL